MGREVEPIIFSVVKTTNDKYYILMEENAIRGFETIKAGLNYYERGYRGADPTSACINWMFFHPSIYKFSGTMEDLKAHIPKIRLFRLGNVSGQMTGLLLEDGIGKKWWDEGEKPSLF